MKLCTLSGLPSMHFKFSACSHFSCDDLFIQVAGLLIHSVYKLVLVGKYRRNSWMITCLEDTLKAHIFIRFYFIHSNSISNSTLQIVPCTKAPRALVSHLKSLYDMFLCSFSKDWNKLRDRVRSFFSRRIIKNLCFLYFCLYFNDWNKLRNSVVIRSFLEEW